jgi:hypothetical protein
VSDSGESSLTLEQWHTRLEQDFTRLREERRASGSKLPIFALEHGLEQPELQELSAAIRAHAERNAPSREHALAWVVYATEVGYRFSGEEYWQTFEEETPGWTVYGNRDWIRERFRQFHSKFDGAEPSGRWAQHFSIICWPITHAILPQDLQQQLAEILYDLRYQFSAELLKAPASLGNLIATHSWNRSSRFQNFSEETLLVGQIAAALLVQGEMGADTLIHPATLRRIRNDLDREQRGREWLRDARHSARESVRIGGFARSRGVRPAPDRPEDARREATELGIEPRLVLRPTGTESSGSSWQVLLEIPNLSHLLLRFPTMKDIITGTRCVIAGARGSPMARGRCLFGPQRVELARWPRPDEVLLQFERPDKLLEFLLRTECLLRPGPRWLFRIASDGLAYELRTLQVRAGCRYILLGPEGDLQTRDGVRPLTLACQGIRGIEFDLPTVITPEWQGTLRTLGLALSSAIDVWPAGLAAIGWDGEGYAEWTSDEQPCIGIQADCDLEELTVSLGSDPPLTLSSLLAGEGVFVQLPTLPVGLHVVHVVARSSSAGWADIQGRLDVVIRAREVRQGSSGISAEGPLLLQTNPPTPTLEQLWEGEFEVSVIGPVGRQLKCRVSLFERFGGAPTVTHQLPPLPLPVTVDAWQKHFKVNFCAKGDVESRYDSARACEITFSADELGVFSIRCEREMTPLRWVPQRVGQTYKLRLIENVGIGAAAIVSRFTFERPGERQPLDPIGKYEVPVGGGLYEAQLGGFSAAIVMPPAVHNFSDLGCEPVIEIRRSIDAVIQLVRLARMWGTARLPGNLMSGVRQRTVLRALVAHMFRQLAGDTWAIAEEAAKSPGGFLALGRMISKKHQAIGAALSAEVSLLATATSRKRVERFVRVVGLQIEQPVDLWIGEFALRLASRPVDVEQWAGERFPVGVGKILDWQTLTRAARFIVLSIDQHLQSTRNVDDLFAGWAWE